MVKITTFMIPSNSIDLHTTVMFESKGLGRSVVFVCVFEIYAIHCGKERADGLFKMQEQSVDDGYGENSVN